MESNQSQSGLGNSQLDTTIGALKGGLANAAGVAGSNIAGWIKTLQGNSQFSGISSELQNLHDALSSGASDTGALAKSLSTLGEHTTKAAASATPDAQDKLRQLGQALSSAAGQLRGEFKAALNAIRKRPLTRWAWRPFFGCATPVACRCRWQLSREQCWIFGCPAAYLRGRKLAWPSGERCWQAQFSFPYISLMSFISEVESSIRVLFDSISSGFQQDPGKGFNQIDNWIEHLRSVDQPALRPIVQELETLRGHIEGNNAAGMAVAFQNLGELTAQSALSVHNFSGNGDKAREISQKLISAAGNLRHIAQMPVH